MVGGYDKNRALRTAFRYDPETDVWTQLASMSRKRSALAVAASGNQIFAMGGFDGTNLLASVEVFNIVTGQWSEGTPMPWSRSGHAVAVPSFLVPSSGVQTTSYDGTEETLTSVDSQGTQSSKLFNLTNVWEEIVPPESTTACSDLRNSDVKKKSSDISVQLSNCSSTNDQMSCSSTNYPVDCSSTISEFTIRKQNIKKEHACKTYDSRSSFSDSISAENQDSLFEPDNRPIKLRVKKQYTKKRLRDPSPISYAKKPATTHNGDENSDGQRTLSMYGNSNATTSAPFYISNESNKSSVQSKNTVVTNSLQKSPIQPRFSAFKNHLSILPHHLSDETANNHLKASNDVQSEKFVNETSESISKATNNVISNCSSYSKTSFA